MLARPALPLGRWPRLLVVAGALLAADVITQDLGWRPSWHPTRLLTGALFGYTVTVASLLEVTAPSRARATPASPQSDARSSSASEVNETSTRPALSEKRATKSASPTPA